MKLTVTSSPHIRGDVRINRLMLEVIIALVPALAVGCVVLGIRALYVTLVSIAAAIAAEALFNLAARRKNSLGDCTAPVTGMLLAMSLPAAVPFRMAAAGSAFAVIAVKLLSGGAGRNVFNPALMGRAALMLAFPAAMTRFTAPGVDGVTAATPLHRMIMPALPAESVMDMFLGRCPGCIGEISGLALLIGGAYLIIRRVISARIPLAYLATVAVISLVFHKTGSALVWMLYNLFGGGVMLAAFFMATDYVTAPVTCMGQIIFGVGCGALTMFFRNYGLFPEGVTYAILLMNLLTWALDRFTAPRIYGAPRGEKRNA